MNRKKSEKLRRLGLVLLLLGFLLACVPSPSLLADGPGDFQIRGQELVRYTGSSSSVTIPLNVTRIAEGAFEGNQELRAVSASEGLVSIGNNAFSGCQNLTSVSLPGTVKSIGNFAFSGDKSLSAVSIGNGLEKLGSGVFSGCSSLASVSLGVDELGNAGNFVLYNGAIYNKTGTTLYAYLPGSAASSFSMPEVTEKIMDYAFYGAGNLTSISFSAISEIPAFAFARCASLQSVNIPASVSRIEKQAFAECVSLEYAYIPPSTAYIHPTAFDGCDLLTIGTDGDSPAQEFIEKREEEPEIKESTPKEPEEETVNSTGLGLTGTIDGNTRLESENPAVYEERNVSSYGISASLRSGAASDGGNVTGRSRVLSGRAYIPMEGSGVLGGEKKQAQSSVVFEGSGGNLSDGGEGETSSEEGSPAQTEEGLEESGAEELSEEGEPAANEGALEEQELHTEEKESVQLSGSGAEEVIEQANASEAVSGESDSEKEVDTLLEKEPVENGALEAAGAASGLMLFGLDIKWYLVAALFMLGCGIIFIASRFD
ncbi:MAG: leucine-rich repeat protein [Lachnospiraceae bacterium]|nr:leucine-rich repeat protein [Lachnospiraceae bacterium]